jgi:hypothetical protein
MGDRGLSKIRKTNQRLVRHLAHLSHGLNAGSEQRILDASGKSDVTNRRVVRKLWRRLNLAHLPFALKSNPENDPIVNRAIDNGSLRVDDTTG